MIVGIVSISDGKSKPHPVRLQLTQNYLILSKDVLPLNFFQKDNKTSDLIDHVERTVTISKRKFSTLGISLKGGSEHNLPMLISKIIKDYPADVKGNLFVGDAILKVNGKSLCGIEHDAAISILRNAGENVTLVVKHYSCATPFLVRNANEQKQSCNESSSNSIYFHLEEDWQGFEVVNEYISTQYFAHNSNDIKVPLYMAYITRYISGTDKLRHSAFEVCGIDGTKSGIIHCESPLILSNWIKKITNNIQSLINLNIKLLNQKLKFEEHILYIGWISEALPSNFSPWKNWKMRIVAIKGRNIYIFKKFPTCLDTWNKCGDIYPLYFTLFKMVKESNNIDERQHCFIIETVSKKYYFSVETRQELLKIQSSWTNALQQAVSKKFEVIHDGQEAFLLLDWDGGFILYDRDQKIIKWQFKFSELKKSSDDKCTILKLTFQSPDFPSFIVKELMCMNLQELLYSMNAFVTAKVISVDPTFLEVTTQEVYFIISSN